MYWAALGLVFLLVQAWVFTRWALDGNVHAHPSGGYEMSTARKAVTHAVQAGGVLWLSVLAVLHWRESRALGRVSLRAAGLAGLVTTVWLSPYASVFHYAGGHNRYGLNVETWGPYLPFWQGELPAIESLNMATAFVMFQIWTLIALNLYAWLLRHRPGWSRSRAAWVTTASFLVIDPALNFVYVLLGGYAFPRGVPYFTLLEGSWYQLPLTSTLGVTLLFVLPVMIMVARAEEPDEIVVFAGSGELPGARNTVRLLAGVGLMNVCILAYQMLMLVSAEIGYPIDLPSWLQRPTV
ncbi:spirocyclase AveC family protein [Streptomyces sp. NPDC101181]|uniref:spirocyclase AveC family protein n=1 Tax=Streptomyces sp. NPDC101181 TaxID=3366125 RepID=UPI0037FF1A46